MGSNIICQMNRFHIHILENSMTSQLDYLEQILVFFMAMEI